MFTSIGDTAVDEEFIAMLIKNSGFKGIYVDNAIVYNHGPKTISDFLKQRRRVYCGHLQLKKKTGYRTSTLQGHRILSEAINVITPRTILPALYAAALEISGRILGYYDFLKAKNHNIWEISHSTKKGSRD